MERPSSTGERDGPEMKHTTSRLLFAYWDGVRGDRAAPERAQIEPGRIRHILADTFILGLEADGRATFRLAGTRMCALFGRDLKGALFSDLWPADRRAEPDQLIDLVANDTVAVVAGMLGEADLGPVVGLELLLLPLRYGGSTNRRALGALSPSSVPPWLGLAPVHGLTTRSVRVVGGNRTGSPSLPGEFGSGPSSKRRHLVVLEGGLR